MIVRWVQWVGHFSLYPPFPPNSKAVRAGTTVHLGAGVPSICLKHLISGGKQVLCKVQSLALSQRSVVRHQSRYLWHSDKEAGPGEWNGLLGSPSESQTEQELESSVCLLACSTSLPSQRSHKLICSCQNMTSHQKDPVLPYTPIVLWDQTLFKLLISLFSP